jgi:phospholipid/cholesterol/gamma-HCH transport system ATP-binding protein
MPEENLHNDDIAAEQPFPASGKEEKLANGSSQRGDKPVISVSHLKKSFNGRVVLKDINFEVYAGETLGIVGPSGCGKSTILKLLCGLIQPDSGEIVLESKDIGLVFQSSALLNSLTVRENLELALRERKMSKKERDQVIDERLALVGLSDYIDAYPSALSGGQQKRVSFARAIVTDPKIILYDEPTTGLDPVMSTVIEDYMIDLENRLKAACIVVTHQYSTWMRTADRMVLMHAGLVEWEGKPEDALKSDNPYMKQFSHANKEGPILAGSV